MFSEAEEFIDYLRFEKRFSPHTVTAYQGDLEQFRNYLQAAYSIRDICEVNHTLIRSWIMKLMEEKTAARSVNRKITSLKTFYRFLLREKKISMNPMLKIQSPKMPKRLPVFVDKKAMEQLLEGVSFKDDFEGLRDKTIMEMLYGTGMRRAELINLMPADVDLRQMNIKVLGKRNKERIIPIHPMLRDSLKQYVKAREREGLDDSSPFFTNGGKKLDPRLVYRIVKLYLSMVTTLEKKSPHVLRHTFATHMLEEGADLNAIKELLGHASLAATQVYTHNTIEKLKNIHKNAHPKA